MMRLLLDTAMNLVNAGQIPSVSEVAAAAQVSRATAYRYFPTRSALVSAIVDISLGPVRNWKSKSQDGQERINELFEVTFPRFWEFEAQLRAALQLSQEHWLLARAGELKEEQFRRGHRIRILETAAQPLEKSLGKARYQRLIAALATIYGTESIVVLKDMCGANNREAMDIIRWMSKAIVDAALAEVSQASKLDSKKKAKRVSAKI
jgi:AcrR family transcriptional regulator